MRHSRREPPFLEFNFYFDQLAASDALKHLVTYFLRNGASFAGSLMVARSEGARSEAFDRALSPQVGREHVTLDAMIANLDDPDARVFSVDLGGATNVVPHRVETVALESTKRPTKRHVVTTLVDGSVFFPGNEEASEPRLRRATARFRELVVALDPTYAALTSEYGMETPEDLRSSQKGSLAFQHCYVSESYAGVERLDRIAVVAARVKPVRLERGLLVPGWSHPKVSDEALSVAIGRILAERVRR